MNDNHDSVSIDRLVLRGVHMTADRAALVQRLVEEYIALDLQRSNASRRELKQHSIPQRTVPLGEAAPTSDRRLAAGIARSTVRAMGL